MGIATTPPHQFVKEVAMTRMNIEEWTAQFTQRHPHLFTLDEGGLQAQAQLTIEQELEQERLLMASEMAKDALGIILPPHYLSKLETGDDDAEGRERAWKPTNAKNGLILWGDKGTGKTHSAAAITKKLCLSNGWHRIVWINTVQMFASIRDAINGKHYQRPIFDTAQFIIIDDLARERPSQFTIEALYRIFNTIYENDIPFIVTSNVNPNELEPHVGEFVQDRLKEKSIAVSMLGPSRRSK